MAGMAFAASADVVHFQNGDRLTGTVVRSDQDVVSVDVPHIGLVTTPRAQVRRVEFDETRRAEPADGRDAEPGEVEADWETRADLGVLVASGNTEAQDFNFVAGFKRTGVHFDNVLGLAVRRAEAKARPGFRAVTTKDQFDLDYDLRWKYGESWYAVANFEYFRDPIKNIEQRATAGAGVGHTFWDSSRGALRTDAGVSQVFEEVGLASQPEAGETSETENNPAFRWGVQ